LKKTLLSGAVILALGVASNTSAITIDVTSMVFGSTSVVSGRISTNTLGDTYSGVFFSVPWTATTVTAYDSPGSYTWAGTSALNAFSYNFTLTEGQYAWGTFFDWSTSTPTIVLNIMDCSDGVTCTGIGTPMQTGPFIGQAPAFNGVVVPVPATVWLFVSGLISLTGFARHRRAI